MTDHNPFELTINYEGVRKGMLRDVRIYGESIAREIEREYSPTADYLSKQVLDPDDVHSLLAALNTTLACIDSQEALDETRSLLNDITGKVAAANRKRHSGLYGGDEENDDDAE